MQGLAIKPVVEFDHLGGCGKFPSGCEHFHLRLQNIVDYANTMSSVIELKDFTLLKVCKHPRKVRYLFRDDLYEFLRCEGCGQIVRLPL